MKFYGKLKTIFVPIFSNLLYFRMFLVHNIELNYCKYFEYMLECI